MFSDHGYPNNNKNISITKKTTRDVVKYNSIDNETSLFSITSLFWVLQVAT